MCEAQGDVGGSVGVQHLVNCARAAGGPLQPHKSGCCPAAAAAAAVAAAAAAAANPIGAAAVVASAQWISPEAPWTR